MCFVSYSHLILLMVKMFEVSVTLKNIRISSSQHILSLVLPIISIFETASAATYKVKSSVDQEVHCTL